MLDSHFFTVKIFVCWCWGLHLLIWFSNFSKYLKILSVCVIFKHEFIDQMEQFLAKTNSNDTRFDSDDFSIHVMYGGLIVTFFWLIMMVMRGCFWHVQLEDYVIFEGSQYSTAAVIEMSEQIHKSSMILKSTSRNHYLSHFELDFKQFS